uniref:Zgc:194221 n=1 Tax=Sander lucioperca TaxID=283035 RepID=A0A8D0A528_SANLU
HMVPVIIVAALLYFRRKKPHRRHWVHPTRSEVTRQELGLRIAKMNTFFRQSIGPAQHLAICLRYLSTGDSLRTKSSSYRVSAAIWDALLPEYLPAPCLEDWRAIAEGFSHRWNFPNLVIQAPDNSGSLYYNYKSAYSIVLLAVVDADYLFRVVDVGGYGRTSDGGSLHNSAFGEGLRDGTLDLSEDVVIPGSEHCGPMPFVFVGDEAFPLRRNLMRPFPGPHVPGEQRVYNYRLSRARLVVECAFGILSSWRMYRRVMAVSPTTAETCVRATCVLHNYLHVMTLRRRHRAGSYRRPGDGSCLQRVSRMSANNAPREALRVRNNFTSYFSEAGTVPWQVQP